MEIGLEQYLRTMPMQTRNNPLEVKREMTDSIFIVLLIVAVSTWIGSITYVFRTEEGSIPNITMGINASEFFPEYQKLIEVKEKLNGFDTSMSAVIWIICAIFAIISIKVFLRALRYRTESCTLAGYICTTLYIIGKPFHIYFLMSDELRKPIDYNPFSSEMFTFVEDIVVLFYFVISIVCIMKPVSLSDIAEITRNIMRVLHSFEHIILFGFISLILGIIIVCISGTAMTAASRNEMLSLTIPITGAYFYTFIDRYVRAVIFQMTATWQWARKNKARVPDNTTFRSIVTVTRYHLGSIAFNATIILPVCVAIIAAFTSKISANRSHFSRFVNIFFIPYLILYSQDYALAVTAMNGQNFYQSTKTVFRTLTKNSPLSFAFIMMYVSALIVVGLLVATLSGLPILFWGFMTDLRALAIAIIVSISSAFIVGFVGQMLDPIKAANLIYMMDNDKSDEKNRNNYAMSSSRAKV